MPNPIATPDDRTTHVAVIQMRCTDNKQANVATALDRIATAAAQGAEVVCLQELFTGPYPCQQEDYRHFDWAESIPGPTTDLLAHAAHEHRVAIVGSLFERRTPGLYHNSAVIFDHDGTQLGIYRKMHIPDDPHFYEKFYFTPGDLGFRSFSSAFGRLGVCVCWDQWFPEAARLTALRGAQILFYPTAIGWLPEDRQPYGASQYSAWETMLRSHAIANGVFVAAPNRVGREADIEFWGGSLIIDPNGNVIGRGPHDAEAIVIAPCNWAQIDAARTHWPFLRDRRIDAYQDLTRRFIDDPSA